MAQSQHRARAHRIAPFFLCACLLSAVVLAMTTAAVETITLSEGSSVSKYGEVLSGLALIMDNASSMTNEKQVQITINNCTLRGGDLSVQFSADASVADLYGVTHHATISNLIVDDSSLVFTGYPALESSTVLRAIQGTMTGVKPLVYLDNFDGGFFTSFLITDVFVEWADGGTGGAVVIGAGRCWRTTVVSFQVQRVHAKKAASLFAFEASKCDWSDFGGNYLWMASGLFSFDYNYCEDCTGPMINIMSASTLVATNKQMIRFANNTITGGQPFFKSLYSYYMSAGFDDGHIILSGIYSDGALFDVPSDGTLGLRDVASLTMRHINVNSLGMLNENTFPYVDPVYYTTNQYVFIGNITVNGVRLEEINGEGYTDWNINYGNTVLVDDMAFIVYNPNELANMGNDDTPSASWAYCQRSSTQGTVSVELYPGDPSVLRASCLCLNEHGSQYCTNVEDSYAFYDGYDPQSRYASDTTTTTTTMPPTETTTTSDPPSTSRPSSDPFVTYAPPKHESPGMPSYVVPLTVVGLLMSALPLVVVVACLLRIQRLRSKEAAERHMYMQQRSIAVAVPDTDEAELNSSIISTVRFRGLSLK